MTVQTRTSLHHDALDILNSILNVENSHEVEALKGRHIPGLGQFHAMTFEEDTSEFIVWFHDESKSTRVITLSELSESSF